MKIATFDKIVSIYIPNIRRVKDVTSSLWYSVPETSNALLKISAGENLLYYPDNVKFIGDRYVPITSNGSDCDFWYNYHRISLVKNKEIESILKTLAEQLKKAKLDYNLKNLEKDFK